jgi:transcriptional regulator with XRE-family HTH domain
MERGWTQQELADRIIRLSKDKQIGVTADTISKWERGQKGISARYRSLLAAAFGVTIDQLGLPGLARGQSAAQPESNSLVAMLDQAAELLDQLGSAGRAVRPQVLAALTDEVLSRRSMLAFVDTPSPSPEPPNPDDLEALAKRYETAYETAAPAPLLTAIAAHLRLVAEVLARAESTGTRQRLLRNRARLAILAGQLSEDLGNTMAARAYYAQATDDAYELGDHAVAGIGHGYSGCLAVNNRQLRAALHHLSCADALGVVDATILSWLATIEADAHAALGDAAAASTAQGRAQELFRNGFEHQAVAWFAATRSGCCRPVSGTC